MSQSFQEYKSIGRKVPEMQQFNNSFIQVDQANMTPHNNATNSLIHIENSSDKKEYTSSRKEAELLRDETMQQFDLINLENPVD